MYMYYTNSRFKSIDSNFPFLLKKLFSKYAKFPKMVH